MSNLYRGAKVSSTNSQQPMVSKPGIYRGTKFLSGELAKSSKATAGTYRGVNWAV